MAYNTCRGCQHSEVQIPRPEELLLFPPCPLPARALLKDCPTSLGSSGFMEGMRSLPVILELAP